MKNRVNELLELVGLNKARDRRLGTYSKGMLQRIGLAQALIHDPRLVDTLLSRLKDKDESARATAAKELSEYRDQRIVPALTATLKRMFTSGF